MSVKVEGLKGFITKLEKFPVELSKNIDIELTEGAELIEGRAKMFAPVDRGLLRSEIVADTSVPLYKEVTDPTFYAPYMEFGTGNNFKANGRGQIAAQFKGSAGRGSFEDMVKNIAAWVKRKGLASTYSVKTRKKTSSKASRANEKAAAYGIAMYILRNGVKPANNGTGYFFRAYDELLPTILSNIKKVLTK